MSRLPEDWIDAPAWDSYVFQADMWCETCAEDVRKDIEKQGKQPEDLDDESSYDSDDYPKGPYSDQESDSPEHCGAHEHCKNAIRLPCGSKIGAWLGGSLTDEGARYTTEKIMDDVFEPNDHSRQVGRLWRHLYRDQLDRHGEVKLVVGNPFAKHKDHSGLQRALERQSNADGVDVVHMLCDFDHVYAVGKKKGKQVVVYCSTIGDLGNFELPLESAKMSPGDFDGESIEVAVKEIADEEGWR